MRALLLALLLLALLLLALPASADTEPVKTQINNTCAEYAMCVSQSSAAVCTKANNADQIVFEANRQASYTFYAVKSTATNYVCDIYSNSQGYDANNTGVKINTESITDESPGYTMSVLLRYLWINCTTVSGGNVTIDMLHCPE